MVKLFDGDIDIVFCSKQSFHKAMKGSCTVHYPSYNRVYSHKYTAGTILCRIPDMYKNTLKARYANQTWQLTIVWFCP